MASCPTFFRKTPGGYATPFDERGFEIGEGWYYVVKTLGLRIWFSGLDLHTSSLNQYYCVQIKQKLGRLEVYYEAEDGTTSPELDSLIQLAQQQAAETCEECRAPGRLVDTNGYQWVACPTHSSARLFGQRLALTPHQWDIQEIDGGPMGVSDFYICRQCGASGGPHLGRPGGEVPSFPPFLAGVEATISIDCTIAKRQIEELRHV